MTGFSSRPTMTLFTLFLVMLLGAGCSAAYGPDDMLCDDPASLKGELDPEAPNYLVVFHYDEEIDANEITEQLGDKYDFTPRSIWNHALKGFSVEIANISDEALAGLRCEDIVEYITYDGRAQVIPDWYN